MAVGTAPIGMPVRLTVSGLVTPGVAMARTETGNPNNDPNVAETTTLAGSILGFYVNNTNAGTLILKYATAAGGAGSAFTGTITPAIGWRKFPVASPTGIYATIGGTALDVTFIVGE